MTPNSKIVILRRAPMSMQEAMAEKSEDKEVQEYFKLAHRSLGSYWPRDSMRPGTGLTLNEENLLLPYVLNIPQADRDFRERATQFFHDISTRVDPDGPEGAGGKRLEIALTDQELPLGAKLESGDLNLPINVMDYIRYRHAISHPEVAMSRRKADGNQLIHYYIDDPTAVTQDNVDKADAKDLAYAAYLEIKGDLNKVKQYLTLLGVVTTDHSVIGQETVKLRDLAVKDPKNFMEVHNDKEKNARFMIKELLSAGVLEEVGSRLLIKESRFQIGATVKEAIAYIRDTENGKQVTVFKGQIQDWRKSKQTTSLADIEADETAKSPA